MYHRKLKQKALWKKMKKRKRKKMPKLKQLWQKTGKRKVSKTWEAMQRLKGSLIVNDPKFLL